jgi:hypothetical protein
MYVPPFDIFHDNEGHFTEFADVVHGDDIGVVQLGDRLGFLLQLSPTVRTQTKVGKNLYRDIPIQFGIVGAQDRSSSAFA